MDNAVKIIDNSLKVINDDIRITQGGILELHARITGLANKKNILENIKREILKPKEEVK